MQFRFKLIIYNEVWIELEFNIYDIFWNGSQHLENKITGFLLPGVKMERHHRKIVWHEKFRVLDEKLAQDADHVEARVFEYYTRPDNVICTHGYSQLENKNYKLSKLLEKYWINIHLCIFRDQSLVLFSSWY